MRRRYTGKQRADLVDLVRSGRATVAQAAARLGVTPSTAYYWTRAPGGANEQAARGPRFVRVLPSSAVTPGIAVRVGVAEIQVRRGFDPELLRTVVEALGGIA